MEPQTSRIDWLKVTAQEREDYYHKSKNLLDQLQVPTEVRHCQNFNCTDEKHLEEIENLYAELTSVLLAAASSAIIKPRSHIGKRSITKTDPHHYQHWWEGQMVVQRLLKCGKTILKD